MSRCWIPPARRTASTPAVPEVSPRGCARSTRAATARMTATSRQRSGCWPNRTACAGPSRTSCSRVTLAVCRRCPGPSGLTWWRKRWRSTRRGNFSTPPARRHPVGPRLPLPDNSGDPAETQRPRPGQYPPGRAGPAGPLHCRGRCRRAGHSRERQLPFRA
jgi:hypothetical protein